MEAWFPRCIRCHLIEGKIENVGGLSVGRFRLGQSLPDIVVSRKNGGRGDVLLDYRRSGRCGTGLPSQQRPVHVKGETGGSGDTWDCYVAHPKKYDFGIVCSPGRCDFVLIAFLSNRDVRLSHRLTDVTRRVRNDRNMVGEKSHRSVKYQCS